MYETARNLPQNYYAPGIAFRNEILFEELNRRTFTPEEFAATNIDRFELITVPSMLDFVIGVQLDLVDAEEAFEKRPFQASEDGDSVSQISRMVAEAVRSAFFNDSFQQRRRELEELKTDPDTFKATRIVVNRTRNAGIVAVGGEVIRFWGQEGYDSLDLHTRGRIEYATQSLHVPSPFTK